MRLVRLAASSALLACLAPGLARADADLLLARALGDELTPTPRALAVGPDDALVIAGRGAQRWSAAGEPLATVASGALDDVAATADGWAIVGADGLVRLDALGEPLWHVPAAQLGPHAARWRVALGGAGTVAALADGHVHVFSAAGARLASVDAGDVALAALAVDDARATVLAVGTATRAGCDAAPAQVATLLAFDLRGAPRWRAYGHAAADMCAVERDLSAATRGVDVTVGGDGLVYFLGEADGAASVFRAHAQHPGAAAPNVVFDRYSDPDEARSTTAYFARLDGDGEPLAGQFLGLPAADGPPARLSVRAIAADRRGVVVIAGATDRSPYAPDERPTSEALGQPVGFIHVADPDLGGRRWHLVEDLPGEHAVVDLALADDIALALLAGAGGDAVLAVPLGDASDPASEVEKRPNPDTQGTFGYESGISGSDPTCYCDADAPRPAAPLAVCVLVLAGLPRPGRRK